MQKVLVVFLAFLILTGSILPNSNFQELSKMAFLLEHFHEHQLENSEIGFLEFLNLHYANTDHQNTQHTESHQKLPLMQINSVSAVFQAQFPAFSFNTEFSLNQSDSENHFSYLSSLSQVVAKTLIKPPIRIMNYTEIKKSV